MEVRKRDGRIVPFNDEKIVHACVSAGCTRDEAHTVAAEVTGQIMDNGLEQISVEEIQDMVEATLIEHGFAKVAKSYILYRAERAKLRVKFDASAVADYIIASKYARVINGRRETWNEIVDRRMSMDLKDFPHLKHEIHSAYELVRSKVVLPSMRSLQFAGPAIEANHARMFNCSFTVIDRIEVFGEIFWLLLSGCGVGYSVERHHIQNLGTFTKPSTRMIHFHRVDDTIEGWAEAVNKLVTSYKSGFYVEFDYSRIRNEGAPLRVSGGVAPGHLPLKVCLEKIRAILDNVKTPTSLVVHDIICFIAEAVLSGGIRRSSLIALFDPDDFEMRTCKTGDWWKTNPQRAMANNSAAIRDSWLHDFFELNVKSIKESGEPGFFRADNPFHGTNPCGEIGLSAIDDEGNTGFGFCNLCEINVSVIENLEGFLRACRSAALIGTLQAARTNFHFLGPASRAIAKRDALLGIGITGYMDNPKCKEWLREGVTQIRVVNEWFAKMIGINSARRLTCVKPSGTASLALGAVASGIHLHHAKKYFRRVTANKNEDCFLRFRAVNPHMCEEKPNGDWIITFPMKAEGKTLADMSAVDFIKEVEFVYKNWVCPGTMYDDRGLTHNVSATVVVRDEEWPAVIDYVEDTPVQAISFLSHVGDKTYQNAPREAVVTEEDNVKWNRLMANYKPVDYTDASGTTDFGSACEGGLCEIRGN